MPDSPTDFIKRLASDRLKRVDLLLKQGKLDEAITEIAQIRQLDPANAYARAYEERILELKADLDRKTASEAAQPPAPRVVVPPPVSVKEPEIPHPSAPRPTPPAPSPKTKRTKGRILLVDDNTSLLAEMAELLQDDGYDTMPFALAEHAFDYLKDHMPDLIICDVNLETSEYGGFTFYEKMREIDRLHEVPFLFLSGLKDTALVLAGKELGADDYLTKPVEPETLLAVVRGKIKRYRQIRKKKS